MRRSSTVIWVVLLVVTAFVSFKFGSQEYQTELAQQSGDSISTERVEPPRSNGSSEQISAEASMRALSQTEPQAEPTGDASGSMLEPPNRIAGLVPRPEVPVFQGMTIDEAISKVREEPIDQDWAPEKQEELRSRLQTVMESYGSSPTLVECRSKNCIVEWYGHESIREDNPQAFMQMMLTASETGGVAHLVVDEANKQRGSMIVSWE
ncbi:MAG: hypothetical protein AAFY69_09565 [Pseudomonadota bacterium]